MYWKQKRESDGGEGQDRKAQGDEASAFLGKGGIANNEKEKA